MLKRVFCLLLIAVFYSNLYGKGFLRKALSRIRLVHTSPPKPLVTAEQLGCISPAFTFPAPEPTKKEIKNYILVVNAPILIKVPLDKDGRIHRSKIITCNQHFRRHLREVAIRYNIKVYLNGFLDYVCVPPGDELQSQKRALIDFLDYLNPSLIFLFASYADDSFQCIPPKFILAESGPLEVVREPSLEDFGYIVFENSNQSAVLGKMLSMLCQEE